MDVFLLRHGQSEYNIGLSDHLDSPLTDLGRRQAAKVAERLRTEDIRHVYVSPLRRTLQTIGPFCKAAGLNAEIVADACEFFSSSLYADFPGLSAEAIAQDYPHAVIGDLFPCQANWWPQEVESDAALYARAERVRDTLLQRHGATSIHLLIVSHADTVGRLIEAFLRVSPRPDDPPWSDNCAITRLTCPTDPNTPASIVYQNDTAYLGNLRS